VSRANRSSTLDSARACICLRVHGNTNEEHESGVAKQLSQFCSPSLAMSEVTEGYLVDNRKPDRVTASRVLRRYRSATRSRRRLVIARGGR